MTYARSYKQITQVAERRIKIFMRTAQGLPDGSREQQLYRDWAYGVYILWADLTQGWQKDGDDERLEALTNRAMDAALNKEKP